MDPGPAAMDPRDHESQILDSQKGSELWNTCEDLWYADSFPGIFFSDPSKLLEIHLKLKSGSKLFESSKFGSQLMQIIIENRFENWLTLDLIWL